MNSEPAGPGRTRVAIRELPVFLDEGSESVFAIVSVPAVAADRTGVVLMATRATFYANRVSVRLGRELARRGFHALRLDFRGLGDSTGQPSFVLDEPRVADAQAAVRWLEEHGAQRIVVVGHCYGARTALAMAQRESSVVGVAAIALPIVDPALQAMHEAGPLSYVRQRVNRSNLARLLDARSVARYLRRLSELLRDRIRARIKAPSPDQDRLGPGVSRSVMTALRVLRKRRVKTLLLYGRHDSALEQLAQAGRPHEILQGGWIDLRATATDPHGFLSPAIQDEAIEIVAGWVQALVEDTVSFGTSGRESSGDSNRDTAARTGR